MLNSPFPCSLKSEAKKAAKILRDFAIPSIATGADRIIPGSVIRSAKGLAILTVVKAGFLLSARAGSGIVVARLQDGAWSAPSAIGIAGFGGGLEIGAEVTDFVIILNTQAAVQAFSRGGNVTLGGNLTVAAGPLGRNMEGDVALRGGAAVYTYSKTKGLFVGISIEGSAIIERKEANRKFYGDSDIRAWGILSGDTSPPVECRGLYEVLEHHEEMAKKAAVELEEKRQRKASTSSAEITAAAAQRHYSAEVPASQQYGQVRGSHQDIVTSPGRSRSLVTQQHKQPLPAKVNQKSTDAAPILRGRDDKTWSSVSAVDKNWPSTSTADKYWSSTPAGRTTSQPLTGTHGASGVDTVRVIYPFTPLMECDLDIHPGDVIEVLTRTSNAFDWWEGRLRGRTGLFPANYTTG